MNIQALIHNLTEIAKAVAPLVPGGGVAVEIAQAAIKAIDALGSSDPALGESRAELEKAVNDHADRTAASLG